MGWVIKQLFHACLYYSQTITPRCHGRPDALLHEAKGLMQKCIRSSTAPMGNSFDYTTSRHEITVYYVIMSVL